jgi:hypothetical protein
MSRTNQKITKPQFFESYKSERTNISNLDTASAYITKKAIQSSITLAEKDFTTPTSEGVWGGLHSRFNLAVEMIPMMIKIQNASGSKSKASLRHCLTYSPTTPLDSPIPSSPTLLLIHIREYGDRC